MTHIYPFVVACLLVVVWRASLAPPPPQPRYDWLAKYESLKPIVEKYLQRTDGVLIPGCGNAEFSFDLYDNGYTHSVSIDNSSAWGGWLHLAWRVLLLFCCGGGGSGGGGWWW